MNDNSNNKKRLDVLMVEKGLAPTRSKAQNMVESGLVEAVCGGKLTKPGQNVPVDIELRITESDQWVSRAAQKLDHAIKHWKISALNKTCLDIGASTGGFCEVLLKNGAARIYAVDVGHGQMHPTIAADKRIISLEKTNIKDINPSIIPHAPELLTCDVSFISLEKALPAALAIAALGAEIIALIKPQFEVGRENIGEGVVRDEKLHTKTCEKIKAWLEGQNWLVCGLEPSPILGGKGNREFLIYAKNNATK